MNGGSSAMKCRFLPMNAENEQNLLSAAFSRLFVEFNLPVWFAGIILCTTINDKPNDTDCFFYVLFYFINCISTATAV